MVTAEQHTANFNVDKNIQSQLSWCKYGESENAISTTHSVLSYLTRSYARSFLLMTGQQSKLPLASFRGGFSRRSPRCARRWSLLAGSGSRFDMYATFSLIASVSRLSFEGRGCGRLRLFHCLLLSFFLPHFFQRLLKQRFSVLSVCRFCSIHCLQLVRQRPNCDLPWVGLPYWIPLLVAVSPEEPFRKLHSPLCLGVSLCATTTWLVVETVVSRLH